MDRRVLGDEATQVARMVIIAAAGWQVCEWLGARTPPIFAVIVPLAALRTEPYSTFSVSIGRLVGVAAGLLTGLAVLRVVHPSTLAIVLVLTISLLVGMALRTAGALNTQVAISALLVFSSSDPARYGDQRLWETAVGVAVTLVLAPVLFHSRPSLEFYDLVNDPDELINLAARTEYAPALAEHAHALWRWMQETGDPLLDRAVTPPLHRHTLGQLARAGPERSDGSP